MQFSLKVLEARLEKVIAVTTTEIEQDKPELKGKFVFRSNGEKFMWSDKPIRHEFLDVNSLADADHIMFLCPLCFEKNGGAVGTHSVMVTFAGRDVPEEAGSRDSDGKPSRWTVSGSSLDDLSLSPSILLGAKQPPESGCHWHGWVGSSGIAPGHAG